MKNYNILGITGPTGSGKSLLSFELSKLGYTVIYADKLAHEVLEANALCKKTLVNEFGYSILDSNNNINRKKLAEIAFASIAGTVALNEITHCHIIVATLNKIEECINNNQTKLIFDAPLLFESKSHLLCDNVIAVLADKSTRLARIVARDNIPVELAQNRMNRQFSDDFYCKNSDIVLYNNGSIESLLENALKILQPKLRF